MRERWLIYLILLASAQGYSQVLHDTAAASASIKTISKFYTDALGSESPLYVGSDYAEYESMSGEHPFYLDDDWFTGSVRYNGHTYQNIPLQFDIQHQKVITEHLSSRQKMELVAEKISSFVIGSHTFVRLDNVVNKNFREPDGFYDLLLDGSVKVYARRMKEWKQEFISGKFESRFDESSKYYYFKNNQYFAVKGIKSAREVLADKKTKLKQALKKSKINLHKNREQGLIEIARIYNQLP